MFREASNIGYLRGCAIALNLWFYEVNKTRKKAHFGRTPRIQCCGEHSYKKQVSIAALIDFLEGKQVSLLCPSFKMHYVFISVALHCSQSFITHLYHNKFFNIRQDNS